MSERVRELIRQGAELVLQLPEETFDAVDAATVSMPTMRAVADDPSLLAAVRRSTRANLRIWATANVRDPGEPVEAHLGRDQMTVARDLVRRGLDEISLDTYRTGQNAAWLRWMELCFTLTDDPAELRELLEVSSRSISGFVDATIAAITERMATERAELLSGSQAERREAVALVLDGAPIPLSRAEERLGYRLTGPHTAAVVWSQRPQTDLGTLERVAEMLTRESTATARLRVQASATTLWVWLHTRRPIDQERLLAALGPDPDVRVALGAAGTDVEGFRRSHQDAVLTQRLLARGGRRVAGIDDVRLAALLSHDREAAAEFTARTLGALETADPELRRTALAYVRAGCNANRAAAELFTHRNTVLRRLARVDDLLPRPLADSVIAVSAALELLDWW